MAFNLNGFNFNQSVVDSQGRVINTWAMHPFHMLGVAGVFGGSLFSAMHGSLNF
jgi:hypothetical protein